MGHPKVTSCVCPSLSHHYKSRQGLSLGASRLAIEIWSLPLEFWDYRLTTMFAASITLLTPSALRTGGLFTSSHFELDVELLR